MKEKIGFNRVTSIVTIFLLSLLMTKCEWFRDDPLYVGVWQYKDVVSAGEFTYNTTRTLTLTKDTYEEIFVMQRDNSSTIATTLALKGDLEVDGDKMTFNLTAVGDCVKDVQDKCTSQVEWFAKGSSTYNTYIQYLEESYEGEFEADEDYLWLVRDMNNDSDTEDDGEDIEFERL
jgi:hypothetical protein